MKIGDLLYLTKTAEVFEIMMMDDRLVHAVKPSANRLGMYSFGINDVKFYIERKEVLLLNTELSRLLFSPSNMAKENE